MFSRGELLSGYPILSGQKQMHAVTQTGICCLNVYVTTMIKEEEVVNLEGSWGYMGGLGGRGASRKAM